MKIDVGKAFNLASDDDEGWKKALIFLGVTFLCTIGMIAILPGLFLILYGPGFVIQYTRNVATGDNQRKLPEPLSAAGLWHGFVALLVYIVYCLPLLGVAFVGFAGAIGGLAAGAKMDSALVGMSSLAGAGLMGLVALFLGLVVACFLPMVTLQYCRNFQFGDAFNFGAILSGMFQSPLDYFVVLAVPFGLNMAVGFIPLVGPFLTPLVGLVGANLVGQYGAKVLDMYSASAAQAEGGTGLSRPSDDFGSF